MFAKKSSQIAFDFLSILILRDHSKWRASKNEHRGGIMLIRMLVLKVLNDERKKSTFTFSYLIFLFFFSFF